MVNFGGQEVKGRGHTTPKLDLEAFSRRLQSSRFALLLKIMQNQVAHAAVRIWW